MRDSERPPESHWESVTSSSARLIDPLLSEEERAALDVAFGTAARPAVHFVSAGPVKGARGLPHDLLWFRVQQWVPEASAWDRPAAVVLDVDSSPWGLLERVAEFRAVAPSTPLIVTTSSPSRSHQLAAFAAGADQYVTNPCEEVVLATALRLAKEVREGKASPRPAGHAATWEQEMDDDQDFDPRDTMEITIPPGAVSESRRRLVCVRGASMGHAHPVTKVGMVIGRDPSCDVSISDPTASRRHARLRALGAAFVIEDLGSRGGTWLNGVEVSAPMTVELGDRIDVGAECTFLFTHDDPLEQTMRERSRMVEIGRIAAGVSHDFNNLMAAALATLVSVEQGVVASGIGPETQEALTDLQMVLARAGELTKTLATLGRRSSEDREAVDAAEVCHEVAKLCRRTFGTRYEIACEAPSEVAVEGNRTELHQVLLNLCLNARDAMSDGGRITIRASVAGAEARIEVEDGGEGMKPEVVSRIFDPFFTTKGEGQGSGLGLATVGELVRGSNGSIEVDSAVGEGTRFRLRFPKARSAPPPRPALSPAASATRLRAAAAVEGGLVVVADDQAVVRKSIARLLSLDGHQVHLAADGEGALALFDELQTKPDVMVVDLDMPVLGGHHVLEAVRSMPDAPDVVIISGHWNPERSHEILANGAAAYLGKPFQVAELREVVAMLVTKRRGRARQQRG